MNMKQCITSCLLSITFVAVVLLSFTDCVYGSHSSSWSAWDVDSFTKPVTITFSNSNYSPIWVCIFAVIQLILLWVLRKPSVCWAGIVLNIAGNIFPVLRYIFIAQASVSISTMFSDTYYGTTTYTFGTPVYMIISLSVLITILYIFLFAFRRETNSGLIQVQANPYSVNGAYAYPGSGETEKLINGDNSNQDNGGNIDPISGEEGNEGTLN